jgi:hypothetical protein
MSQMAATVVLAEQSTIAESGLYQGSGTVTLD